MSEFRAMTVFERLVCILSVGAIAVVVLWSGSFAIGEGTEQLGAWKEDHARHVQGD